MNEGDWDEIFGVFQWKTGEAKEQKYILCIGGRGGRWSVWQVEPAGAKIAQRSRNCYQTGPAAFQFSFGPLSFSHPHTHTNPTNLTPHFVIAI